MYRKWGAVKNGLLFLVCGSVLQAEVAAAADWSLGKSITVREVYSDNIELSESNKESELITVITPSMTLTGKGGRANVDLAASLELNNLGGGADSLNPRLRANADAELVKNYLFVDASATATQNTIDPFSASGSDTLNRTDNTTTTYTYSISPYWKNRFKRTAELEARYTYSGVSNSGDIADDSGGQAFLLALNSGPDFSKLSWNLTGNYRKTDYDAGSESEFISADATLGYQVNRKWRLNVSVGREWNDFASTQSEKDGARWSTSASWTPSPRTTLNFGFGDSFFGAVPSIDISHRSRRTVITASYSRDLTDTHTLLSNQDIFNETDPFGQPIDPITGNPLPLSGDLATLTDGTFVDERFRASVTVTGRRTTVTLTGNHSRQISQDSTRDVTLMRIGTTISRQLSANLSANAGLDWNRDEETSNTATDTWNMRLGFSRKLGPKSNIGVDYVYTERDSDQLNDSYDENRISLNLSIKL